MTLLLVTGLGVAFGYMLAWVVYANGEEAAQRCPHCGHFMRKVL